jgi:hypothetical protein
LFTDQQRSALLTQIYKQAKNNIDFVHNHTFGVKQMANKLIGVGPDISYDDLISQLEEGEVLMITWLPNPLNDPKVRPVTDEQDHRSIVSSAEDGWYDELRWFASRSGSKNPYDYDMFD